MNWLIENSVLGLRLVQAEKAARKVLLVSLSYQFFKVCADFSASAATSDPVLNDGSSNMAIEPSAERGHYLNKLVMGGAYGTFPAQ